MLVLDDVKLLYGTWVDAFDMPRDASKDQMIILLVHEPKGAECDGMPSIEIALIFYDGFNKPYKHSKAMEYVSRWSYKHMRNMMWPAPA